MRQDYEIIVRENMAEFGEKFREIVGAKKENLATYTAFLLLLFKAYPEAGIMAAIEEVETFLSQAGARADVYQKATPLFCEWERIWDEH